MKRYFKIQSHLFVIFKQLLCGLVFRNIDCAEITNRKTFMLKVGQVHTCTTVHVINQQW